MSMIRIMIRSTIRSRSMIRNNASYVRVTTVPCASQELIPVFFVSCFFWGVRNYCHHMFTVPLASLITVQLPQHFFVLFGHSFYGRLSSVYRACS